MERNQIIAIVVIIVVIAGAGVAFVFMSQPTRPPEDTFVKEAIGEPESLDPHYFYETAGGYVAEQVYETLYFYPFGTASTESSVPLLAAAAPEISLDGKQYNITLRQGVTFHDGTPFNASCVKWNWERAFKMMKLDGPAFMILEPLAGGGDLLGTAYDYGTGSPEFAAAFDDFVENSGALVVLDTYKIQINLEYPFSPFIAASTYRVGAFMSPTFVLSHAENDTLPAGGDWTEHYGLNYGQLLSYMFDHTCGTGPYMIETWEPSEFWKMVLYEDYWRADATEAQIKPPSYAGSIKTIFVRLNTDTTGSMLNLRTGLVDYIGWPAPNRAEIWDETAEESSDPDNIYVSTGGFSFGVTFFSFNMLPLMNYTLGSTTTEVEPPTQSRALRKCFAYAFDYDSCIDAAYSGWGMPAKGIFPQGLFGHNGSYFTENYNITAAAEWWNMAMNEPDFVDRMNGISNTINVYYNEGNTAREQSALILKDGFNAVMDAPGVNLTGLDAKPQVNTVTLEWPTILAMRGRGELLIWLVGWLPDYADPDNYAYPFAISTGIWPYFSGYNNSQVDYWVNVGKQASDTAERQAAYNKVQELMADDQPYIYMIQNVEFRTWRTWCHGEGLNYNPMYSSFPYMYHVYKDYAAYDAA